MQVPVINSDGTSKKELLKQFTVAYWKLSEAVSALRMCAPYGRDYYPNVLGEFEQACNEHIDRIHKLTSVLENLQELIIAIDRQGGE